MKLGAFERLLSLRPHFIEIFTRYYLDKFASGVFDIAALRQALGVEHQVRRTRGFVEHERHSHDGAPPPLPSPSGGGSKTVTPLASPAAVPRNAPAHCAGT
jgi:hypothetical protein